MASLQARHSRSCPLYPWTPFAKAKKAHGCTCKPGPLYHVVTRVDGKLVREPVGHYRKAAEAALNSRKVEMDEETYEAPRNITFNEWADEWFALLRRPKESTRRSYVSTLNYARQTFGSKNVRKIDGRDLDRFLAIMTCTPSTQRKHLRVLGACLALAVKRGYASRNPVRLLEATELPVKRDNERPWFENDELPVLLGAVPIGLHRTLAKMALSTGLRQAELVALRWCDLDLGERVVRVRRIYTPGIGYVEPKSKNSKRDVYVSEALVALLGAWWGELGRPVEDVLVFPGFGRDGQLVDSTIRRVLYDAMKTAGVPREHARTGEPRNFHTFRHTYAKLALESGRSLVWVSRQLGHSDVNVTARVYAHIEDRVRAEAARELVIPGL